MRFCLGVRERTLQPELHDAIRDEVSAQPDVMLAELRDRLAAEHRVSVSLSVLCTTAVGLGLPPFILRRSPGASGWDRNGRHRPGR